MKKYILISLLIGFVFGQTPGLTHGFGFAAGMQSGIGFSYRHMNEKYGYQITLGAIGRNYEEDDAVFPGKEVNTYNEGWTPDTDDIYYVQSWDNDYFWGNIGFLFIKPLHRVDKSSFYAFAGFSTDYNLERYYQRPYKYFEESEYEYSYEPVGPKEEIKESETRFLGGIGLGLSYNVTKNITISLELPLTISDKLEVWMIIPQGAIHYFYK